MHEPLHDGEGDGVDVFRVRAESHLGLAQAAGVLADAVGPARALGVVPTPSQRFSINKKSLFSSRSPLQLCLVHVGGREVRLHGHDADGAGAEVT